MKLLLTFFLYILHKPIEEKKIFSTFSNLSIIHIISICQFDRPTTGHTSNEMEDNSETYPNFNSFMLIKWPNRPSPLKLFLVVINKNKARILNRINRTQKALNCLKIRPTDLELFLDCQTIVCHVD